MMWINGQSVLISVLDNHGITSPSKFMMWGISNIRNALSLIGYSPEKYSLFSRQAISQEGEIAFPKGMAQLREIWLKMGNGKLLKPLLFENRSKKIYGIGSGAANANGAARPVALGEDRECWFFMNGNPADFECALVAFVGRIENCEGWPMIPSEAEAAVTAFLDAEILVRKKNIMIDSVPEQTIQDRRNYARALMADARGKIKMPSKQAVESRILEEFFEGIETPQILG